jgi:hypothetical protein
MNSLSVLSVVSLDICGSCSEFGSDLEVEWKILQISRMTCRLPAAVFLSSDRAKYGRMELSAE